MTDQEKHDLNTRIATLAETAGVDGELLWESAKKCPQGHSTLGYLIGERCDECVTSWWGLNRHGADDAVLTALLKDDTFHPEWRLGRVAKDFTDATPLIEVLEAWRKQKPLDRWWSMNAADWETEVTLGELLPRLPRGTVRSEGQETFYDGYVPVDEDPAVALALAFVRALEDTRPQKGETE